MHATLRRDLTAAIKARDRVAVSALRSVLADLENAQAPDTTDQMLSAATSEHVAGAVAGLAATETARHHLTEIEERTIVEEAIAERTVAAAGYERTGQEERAEQLRSEAAILRRYLR